MSNTLLYRASPTNGGLVLSPPGLAHYVSRIHHAIDKAHTWEEFRALLPPGEYVALLEAMVQRGRDMKQLPAPNKPFVPEWIPGYLEGQYPMWMQAEMGDYLDMVVLDVVERLAVLQTTPDGCEYLFIPPAAIDLLRQELADLGYELEHAPDLLFY